MLPQWKRRIIHNFTAALTYSRQGHGHCGSAKVCMRQLVGCVACARVEWIDEFVPCYLFKACPEEVRTPGDSHSEAESSTEGSGDDGTPARRSTLLRDDAGDYVSNAEAINALLDVRAYIKAWPRITPEELRASSMQHPTYPEYRWLLNTRRVSAQGSGRGRASGAASAAGGSTASEHAVGGTAT